MDSNAYAFLFIFNYYYQNSKLPSRESNELGLTYRQNVTELDQTFNSTHNTCVDKNHLMIAGSVRFLVTYITSNDHSTRVV
jgi:hypothetical protein